MLARRTLIGATLAAALLAGGAPAAAAAQPVLIGGAAADGIDTLAARQICALVNEHARTKYGCIARPTFGAVFNIQAIAAGLMEFGLARSGRDREAFSGLGPWEGAPVTTLRSVFGLHAAAASLVTSAETAEGLVYDVVRTVFENLDALRSAHPTFGGLDPAAMVRGLATPLHPGAARYYRERGWL